MDLMGYADDMSRIELARRSIAIKGDELDLRRQEYEDAHILQQQTMAANRLKMGTQLMGLMQEKTEIDAFKLYDPSNPSSLDLVAKYMAGNGDPKGAMSVIQEQNKQRLFDMNVMQKRQQQQQKEALSVANIASTMTDPDSYRAGLSQLSAQGIDPMKYGLVPDFNQGKARAEQLTQAGIGATERAKLRLQSDKEDRLWLATQERWKNEDKRLDIMDRNSRYTQERLRLTQYGMDLRDKAMQAAQQGKEQTGLNAVQEYARKFAPNLAKTAMAGIDADEDLHDGLNDAQKALLSKQIASEVINNATKSAKQVSDLGSHDWEEEVQSAIDKIKADPNFKKPGVIARRFGATIQLPRKPVSGPVGGATPPVRSKSSYQIGQLVPTPQGKLKVVGFEDGEPLFETQPGTNSPKYYP